MTWEKDAADILFLNMKYYIVKSLIYNLTLNSLEWSIGHVRS